MILCAYITLGIAVMRSLMSAYSRIKHARTAFIRRDYIIDVVAAGLDVSTIILALIGIVVLGKTIGMP